MQKDGTEKKLNGFKKYKDPTGEFTNAQLSTSTWFVKNRELLKRIGLGIIIAWCTVTVVYSMILWGKYFIFDYQKDQALYRSQVLGFTNYESIHALYEAVPIETLRPQVFEAAPGKYDFVTDVINSNERWVAKITYKHVHSRGETQPEETILLPLTRRPVVSFGASVDGTPSGAQLLILDTTWFKINAHVVPAVGPYMAERLDFFTEFIGFFPARASEGSSSHGIDLDLINETAYSYWQPQFYIELFNNQRRVGVLPLIIEQFRAGDELGLGLRSLAPDLSVSEIAVHPIINVFDSSEFMDPGS
ncbi:MAG: hypothetical protein ABII02_04780 [Candidatus Magasanikbacteria bacterium]